VIFDQVVNGYCEIEYANYDFYDGGWEDFLYHGYGELKTEAIDYRGNWVENRRHGQAVVKTKAISAEKLEAVKEKILAEIKTENEGRSKKRQFDRE
jgi:hypothetical protein